MLVSSKAQSSDPSPEPTVDPVVELSAYQRRVAALKAHRPGSLPAPFLGKVLKPHERVKAMAEIAYGQSAADALEALIRPNSKMDRGVARRAMEVLFPKDRPLQLQLPDATTPDALDLSMSLIRRAWTGGQITLSEAEACQRLVRAQYRASITAKAGRL